ncbi:MAG: hypothetical protein VYD64_02140 [Pseudomonadota bacterium]|nr:hypothetical protein [Pseudomonadota bacterium]
MGSPLSTGTVSVTNGAKGVVGLGTTFATDLVRQGDLICIYATAGNQWGIVGAAPSSETAFDLHGNYEGATEGGLSFAIVRLNAVDLLADGAVKLNAILAILEDNATLAQTLETYGVKAKGDADFDILATDRFIRITSALTAARVASLPAASGFTVGARLLVKDESAGLSDTNTLTIDADGADTIDGAGSLVLDKPYEGAILTSNGVDAWTVIDIVGGQDVAARRRILGLDDKTAAASVGDAFVWNGTIWVPQAVREKLAANRTYYVDGPSGNDSNDGLSSGAGAFATIQKGLDVAYGTIDLGGHDVTISVAAATYPEALAIESPQVGAGKITISGDVSTPSNVLVSATNDRALEVRNTAICYVKGIKVAASGSFAAVLASGNSIITLSGKMEFGACAAGHHLAAEYGGVIYSSIEELITANAGGAHYNAGFGGAIWCQSATWTISGSPTLGVFAQASGGGSVYAFANSTTGSLTYAQRYNASLNGVIQSNGGGASYFPGTVGGSTATGGQYA